MSGLELMLAGVLVEVRANNAQRKESVIHQRTRLPHLKFRPNYAVPCVSERK